MNRVKARRKIKVIEKRKIVLELTEDQAALLTSLLGRCSPNDNPSNEIYEALRDLNIPGEGELGSYIVHFQGPNIYPKKD